MDYRMLLLEDRVRAMLDFAVQVTKEVHSINQRTMGELRAKGLSDEDILNVVQVSGFFSYYTRIAEALGVEPESNAPGKVHPKRPGEGQADPDPEKVK